MIIRSTLNIAKKSNMMASTKTTSTFKIVRKEPELIRPSKPTPHEFKPLSDIDDQGFLRIFFPIIQSYRKNLNMEGKDPVNVIREAIAKTLVFYYPFAGRLREHANRKLVVDCTGEGVMFVEADADGTVEDFEDALQPLLLPSWEQFGFDVPGFTELLNCPLLFFQVTRLKCGGFIFAVHVNHTMVDGIGIHQFLYAIGEIARNAETPSILPIWERHLVNSPNPPNVSFLHPEYDVLHDSKGTQCLEDDLIKRTFVFDKAYLSALRSCLPIKLQHSCTIFDLLTAWLWRCRTIAISPNPNEEVRILHTINTRDKFNPPIPVGYYGSVIATPAAISNARDLCTKPFSYALELVKNIKHVVTEEYMKSVASVMVTRDRPHHTTVRSFLVSDLRYFGYGDVDFGWGKAVFGGLGLSGATAWRSIYLNYKNGNGEKSIAVPVFLPAKAMDVFVKELEKIPKPTVLGINPIIRASL